MYERRPLLLYPRFVVRPAPSVICVIFIPVAVTVAVFPQASVIEDSRTLDVVGFEAVGFVLICGKESTLSPLSRIVVGLPAVSFSPRPLSSLYTLPDVGGLNQCSVPSPSV